MNQAPYHVRPATKVANEAGSVLVIDANELVLVTIEWILRD